jgi:hypothetical protein
MKQINKFINTDRNSFEETPVDFPGFPQEFWFISMNMFGFIPKFRILRVEPIIFSLKADFRSDPMGLDRKGNTLAPLSATADPLPGHLDG